MKSAIKDREFDRFRPANNDLSKVAVVVEQGSGNPIPVAPTELGEPLLQYNEELSVAGLSSQTIIDYSCPVSKIVDISTVHVSGDNKSIFTIELNSVVIYKHRIWLVKFSDILQTKIRLNNGDNFKVIVENKNNSVADFNATISGIIYDE